MIVTTGFRGRKATELHFQPSDGDLTVNNMQDVEPILEENKALFNSFTEGAQSRFGDAGFHRVAQIPNVIWVELMRTGILDDPVRFEKWLNDPDNKYFRTRPGRVRVSQCMSAA